MAVNTVVIPHDNQRELVLVDLTDDEKNPRFEVHVCSAKTGMKTGLSRTFCLSESDDPMSEAYIFAGRLYGLMTAGWSSGRLKRWIQNYKLLKMAAPISQYKAIEVYTDGSAVGNNDVTVDNKGAWGFVVYVDGKEVTSKCEYVGASLVIPSGREVDATNNVMEYWALINALQYLINSNMTAGSVTVYSDSQLMVRQINRTSVTKAPHLTELRSLADHLMKQFFSIQVKYIPRKENKRSDQLAAQASGRV